MKDTIQLINYNTQKKSCDLCIQYGYQNGRSTNKGTCHKTKTVNEKKRTYLLAAKCSTVNKLVLQILTSSLIKKSQ